MKDQNDKFRRVVVDNSKEKEIISSDQERLSTEQVVNAETGLPVDAQGDGITLNAVDAPIDVSLAFDSLTAEDEHGISDNLLKASNRKEEKTSSVSLEAKKERGSSDLAFQGEAQEESHANDISFSGKSDMQMSDISFAADKESIEGDASLIAKDSPEYRSDLYQKAEELNDELKSLADDARECAKKAKETMEEVERIAKAKNIPNRLASRLANVKAATGKIRESTNSLAIKRDALKGGNK